MDMEKVRRVLADGNMVGALALLQTAEAVQAALKASGTELTLPEAEAVLEGVTGSGDAELSPDDLDSIAGGYARKPKPPRSH